ncbi:unnamed protein product [Peronospora belbahrii]|uniref:RxLR effector protein n=1 Tax=Peronospora belbahrii TaxID=622444 RepID=A0ABN8D8P4_9STRA|nr:unnamed protein product [Peronospora belbahrii]
MWVYLVTLVALQVNASSMEDPKAVTLSKSAFVSPSRSLSVKGNAHDNRSLRQADDNINDATESSDEERDVQSFAKSYLVQKVSSMLTTAKNAGVDAGVKIRAARQRLAKILTELLKRKAKITVPSSPKTDVAPMSPNAIPPSKHGGSFKVQPLLLMNSPGKTGGTPKPSNVIVLPYKGNADDVAKVKASKASLMPEETFASGVASVPKTEVDLLSKRPIKRVTFA